MSHKISLTLTVESEELVREAKILCLKRRTSLSKVITDALKRFVAEGEDGTKTRGELQGAETPHVDS